MTHCRFDNKRVIIHNHEKAIFEMSSITKESNIAFKQLLYDFNKHMKALESVWGPVNTWNN